MPTGKIVKVLRIGLNVFLVMLFFHHTTLAKDDLEIIRNRVILEITQPLPDDDLMEALVNSIREDGSWANINYEDVSRIAFDHRNHLRNMVLISMAYKNPKSKHHKSKKAKKAVISALEFWVDHDFICDNWWYNQIGTPNSLVTVMLIMDEELPKELVDEARPIIGRAQLNASGARPSGDRINHQMSSPRQEISMDVFIIWIDHGPRVVNGSYQYMIMPSTNIQELEKASLLNIIDILANTPAIQAVRHTGLHIAQVVFYKTGKIRISEKLVLGSDNPGVVMVKTDHDLLTDISVSDPNRELGKMHISVSSRIEKTDEKYRAIWDENKGMSEISITLPQGVYAGKSVTLNF